MKISQVLLHFKKFIERNGIEDLRYEFENLNQDAPLYYGGVIYNCQWNKEGKFWHVEYSQNDQYFEIKETIETYLRTYFNYYLGLIKEELIKHYINLKPSEFKELLSKLDLELYDLIKILSGKPQLLIHLSKALEGIRNEILEKYSNGKPKKLDTSVSNFQKIKWLGTINTLSTFFMEYSSSKNNFGKSLMEYDLPAFKSLIVNCFIDAQGNPISKATVDTYFNLGKQPYKQKKGNRIELLPEVAEEIIQRAESES